MQITLNGKVSDDFEDPISVTALLEHLGLEGQPVLVELNGEPVHRRDFESATVGAGASVELIRIAAGG